MAKRNRDNREDEFNRGDEDRGNSGAGTEWNRDRSYDERYNRDDDYRYSRAPQRAGERDEYPDQRSYGSSQGYTSDEYPRGARQQGSYSNYPQQRGDYSQRSRGSGLISNNPRYEDSNGRSGSQSTGFGLQGTGYEQGHYGPRDQMTPPLQQSVDLNEQNYGVGSNHAVTNSNHPDRDYLNWRHEHIRKLDDEYDAYRKERGQKFGESFEEWRNKRSSSASPTHVKTGASNESDSTNAAKHK